jgi:hypothetical protein
MFLDRVLKKVRSRSALSNLSAASEVFEDYITLNDCIGAIRSEIFDLEKHIVAARSNILITVRCIKTLYPPFASNMLESIFKIPEELEALSFVGQLRENLNLDDRLRPVGSRCSNKKFIPPALQNLQKVGTIPPLISPSQRAISHPVTIASPDLEDFLEHTPQLEAQLALMILKRAELCLALDHLERLLTFWICVWSTMSTTASRSISPERPPLVRRNAYYVISRKELDCSTIQVRMEQEQKMRKQENAECAERAFNAEEKEVEIEAPKRVDSGIGMKTGVETLKL